MWSMWQLVPDLVGRRETADEVGAAVVAAYSTGHAVRGLDQPEDHRHAPYVREMLLRAWKASGRDTEAVLGSFLSTLASSPAGARLTVAQVHGRWEEMVNRAYPALGEGPQSPHDERGTEK
jgi:hypothetical protein